ENRNKSMWNTIHHQLTTKDSKSLRKLLKINWNAMNLSKDGDTVLHSATKSNDKEMVQFILQRISPITKHRMLQWKNHQKQVPLDIQPTQEIHQLLPLPEVKPKHQPPVEVKHPPTLQ